MKIDVPSYLKSSNSSGQTSLKSCQFILYLFNKLGQIVKVRDNENLIESFSPEIPDHAKTQLLKNCHLKATVSLKVARES